jgi:uncharacterized membrane protein
VVCRQAKKFGVQLDMNHPFLGASAAHAAVFAIQRIVWPYFTAIFLTLIGLVKIFQHDLPRAKGFDKALVFGPLFLAMPVAVFGTDHFTFPDVVAGMVPRFIPFHVFWVYFVGLALIAGGVSIILDIYSVLAAALLSATIFSFVLLISVPAVASDPHNRFLLAVMLRDLSFSGGALACAVARGSSWPSSMRQRLAMGARYMISIPSIFFGIEQFLHPHFVPVIPLDRQMPPWMPGQALIAYVTGAVMIAAGLCIALHWRSRLAATWLGIVTFAIVLLVYVPLLVDSFPSVGTGLNYFADTLAFSGAALLFASALPKESGSR